MTASAAPPGSGHDACLAALPPDQRAALERLRALIRARPDCFECMSHAMRTFRGPVIAGFAAFAGHCGFCTFSGSVIRRLARACSGFGIFRNGILFPPARPLPQARVHLIIATRIADLGAGQDSRKATT